MYGFLCLKTNLTITLSSNTGHLLLGMKLLHSTIKSLYQPKKLGYFAYNSDDPNFGYNSCLVYWYHHPLNTAVVTISFSGCS